MTRFLRQTTVVLLILVWNSAGVYRTVCEALCAADDAPHVVAQTTHGANARSSFVRGGGPIGPAGQDSHCLASFQPGKCVTGSAQAQFRQRVHFVQPLVAMAAPAAVAFWYGAVNRTHSPPGFPFGRSICNRLTHLRI